MSVSGIQSSTLSQCAIGTAEPTYVNRTTSLASDSQATTDSSSVSGSSIYQEIESFYQSRQADLKQLGSALQSGDLNGAQEAYNALAALGEDGPFANAEPFAKASRVQDFNTIGQDLQSGNLAGAQAAFAALSAKQSDTASSTQTTQPTTATDDSSSIYAQMQAYRQQRTADLAQLGKDLQAGNLSAAQQDFNTLTVLGQGGPFKNGQTFNRADREQDFQAIGQALQSGDLSGAESAFANLSGTFGKQDQQAQAAASAYATLQQ
jgi:hypothetical protein